jgi:hypothetical protein
MARGMRHGSRSRTLRRLVESIRFDLLAMQFPRLLGASEAAEIQSISNQAARNFRAAILSP